ncbi:MAG: 5-dehydro-4-deoxy-D-glucuronate isomerase, partial [Bacteroidales bacterium]
MTTIFEERWAYNPEDVKTYDTDRIRKEFLVEKLMENDKIHMVYSHIERFITGGAVPASKELKLEPVDALKAEHFCDRREVGIINVGSTGVVSVDGQEYTLD